MGKEAIICLDIGGTNLRIGMVDRQCRLSEARTLSTEKVAEGDFVAGLMYTLEDYYSEMRESYTVRAVVLGVPAAVDKRRRVVLQAPNVPGLDGEPLADKLEQVLGIPVFLAKDVDLLLTYDLYRENLPEDGMIVGIYFGTGIGNSIYLGGEFLTGKNGVAGELGHIPQLGSEIVCGCGNIGCMEPMGGGRQLSHLCETVFPTTHVSQIYKIHGQTPEVRQQVDAMAATVATEVNILDPDYVIIGGGLPQMEGFPTEYFLERVGARCRKPRPWENLDIRFARPNQANGVIGAGIYGWRMLQREKPDSVSGVVCLQAYAKG